MRIMDTMPAGVTLSFAQTFALNLPEHDAPDPINTTLFFHAIDRKPIPDI